MKTMDSNSKSDYKKTLNYLHYKQNYSINKSNGMIRRFGISKGLNFPDKTENPSYQKELSGALKEAGKLAQEDWNEFMVFFASIKDEYEREPKKETYEEWYAEASMNGSLAYNNSADDL